MVSREKLSAETFWTIEDIRKLREELGYTHEHEWDDATYRDFLTKVEKDLVTVMQFNASRFLTSLLKEYHFYDENRSQIKEG